jgi:hypothetical protein
MGRSVADPFTDPDAARKYLSGLSEHKNRAGDTSSLNPEFAVKMANAIQTARAQGIPATFMSGYREGSATGSKYDMGGFSAHGYGLATDVGGIGGAGSKTAQQWNTIAQGAGLHNPYLGTESEGKEWNHWQLPELLLEQMPDQLARLRAAKASGNMDAVWAASKPFMSGDGTMVASAGNTPIGVTPPVRPAGTTVDAPSAPVPGALAAQPSTPGAVAVPTSKSPYGNPFLDSLANIESNNRNIPSTVDKDYPGQPGSKSQGYFQIDTPTWLQFAAKNGIDTVKYPNAMSAPPDVQAQVASQIPLGRFGGRTQKMLGQQFGTLDKTATIGSLASKYGGAAPAAPTGTPGEPPPPDAYGYSSSVPAAPTGSPVAVGTTMGTTPNATPGTAAAPAGAPAAAPTDQPWYQTAYGKLVDKPKDGGKSPMENLSEAFAKGPARMKALEEDQAPEQVKNYTGTAPPARNISPGLQNVGQTYGTTLNSFLQPLTWSSAPPKAPPMLQAGLLPSQRGQAPGMSLNSFQPGLGYGIDPVGYGYG